MIRKMVSVILVVVIILGCPIYVGNKAYAANSMTGFEFLSLVVSEMLEGENIDCRITKGGNGNISVNGIEIAEKKYGKYMGKYKLDKDTAISVAAAVELGLTSGKVKRYKKKITVAGALCVLCRADELANGIRVSEETVKFCMENRINDIGKVRKRERMGEAEGFVRGFIKGSAKPYSHTRALKGHKNLKGKNAIKLIEMLYDTSKRNSLSSDYQITRNTKLPRNAKLYRYIIDSFPNAYYETGFNGMGSNDFFDEGVGLGADSLSTRMQRLNFSFVFPYEIDEFNSLEYPGDAFPYENPVFSETYRNNIVPGEMALSSEEFYRYALNVDYRSIENNSEWLAVMSKYLTEDEIKDYIKHCKENKTIIESDVVAADRSSVYWYNGEYQCKVYAHVRITSDEALRNGRTTGADQDVYGYLYPVKRGYETGTLYTRSVLGSMYLNYKLGEWVDLYFNTSGSADMYGCLCCSNTSRGIMIDYTGLYPWLISFPFLD